MKLISQFTIMLYLLCPTFAFAAPLFIEKPEVNAFIQHMVNKHHFNKEQLIALFKTVKPQPQVIENISHPLEKETWKLYQRVFINDEYIAQGAAFRKKYHRSLVQAEERYGIPGSIIIATLGVETKFGTHSGGYRVIDALSNLAFTNNSRGPYFRSELEQFLLLTRENHLDPFTVQGSYAGAIGAPQFMPSSYRYYAASFLKKTQIDIIHNTQDAIASVANYYQKHGWKTPHFVAIRTTVNGDKYLQLRNAAGTPLVFSSTKLAKYGLTPERKIPQGYKLKLLELEGRQGKEYWLVFPDFDVIKRYNPSNLYAMAVYQLSRNILQCKDKEKIS
jgi:membrane-bound lytic murein transglycosylase B